MGRWRRARGGCAKRGRGETPERKRAVTAAVERIDQILARGGHEVQDGVEVQGGAGDLVELVGPGRDERQQDRHHMEDTDDEGAPRTRPCDREEADPEQRVPGIEQEVRPHQLQRPEETVLIGERGYAHGLQAEVVGGEGHEEGEQVHLVAAGQEAADAPRRVLCLSSQAHRTREV